MARAELFTESVNVFVLSSHVVIDPSGFQKLNIVLASKATTCVILKLIPQRADVISREMQKIKKAFFTPNSLLISLVYKYILVSKHIEMQH